jgi:serine/threonine protein kinase
MASGRSGFDKDELLAPGTILGGYQIERKVGVGGMGTVYAAQHLALRRRVALKVIGRQHTADARQVARFRREARVASKMRHANVVEVLDLGQADGREFIAMEFLEGIDLCDAIILAKGYEPADALPILDQVLQALEVAHAAGLVHRDLKPENVYLAQSAHGELTVKLLDFGVVKVPDESAQAQLTRTGTVVGTPEYMAPEQATTGAVDARADLYALGCIAYAMMTGRPPFVGKSVLLVMAAHVKQQPAPPSRLRPKLVAAAAIDAFIGRALEKKPDKRYQSATQMRAALAELARAIGDHHLIERKITMPSQRLPTLTPQLGSLADDDENATTDAAGRKAAPLAAAAAVAALLPGSNAPAPTTALEGRVREPNAPTETQPREPTVTAQTRTPPPSTPLLPLFFAAAFGAAVAMIVTYIVLRTR